MDIQENLDTTEAVPNRILFQLMGVFCKRVRPQSNAEKAGVVRNLRRLLAQGVTLHEMQTAMEHYIANCETEQKDMRFRKGLRAFFTAQNIAMWQTPLRLKKPQRDPALDILDRFDDFEAKS